MISPPLFVLFKDHVILLLLNALYTPLYPSDIFQALKRKVLNGKYGKKKYGFFDWDNRRISRSIGNGYTEESVLFFIRKSYDYNLNSSVDLYGTNESLLWNSHTEESVPCFLMKSHDYNVNSFVDLYVINESLLWNFIYRQSEYILYTDVQCIRSYLSSQQTSFCEYGFSSIYISRVSFSFSRFPAFSLHTKVKYLSLTRTPMYSESPKGSLDKTYKWVHPELQCIQ